MQRRQATSNRLWSGSPSVRVRPREVVGEVPIESGAKLEGFAAGKWEPDGPAQLHQGRAWTRYPEPMPLNRREVRVSTPAEGGGIGSMELGRLFSDEDLLVEAPLLTYVRPSLPKPDPTAGFEQADEEWRRRTLWEVACVGLGVELGNLFGGSKAMAALGGVAALVWSRRHWPGPRP